jgi:uncharacterized protein YggE
MNVGAVRVGGGRMCVWTWIMPALAIAGIGWSSGADAAVARGGGGLALHGDGGYGVNAQLVPGDQPSIVVIGTGQASAPAASAVMQVVVRAAVAIDPAAASGPVPTLPAPLTEGQVQPVIDAIGGAGIAGDAVEVRIGEGFAGAFGPGTAEIRIAIAREELGLMPDLLAAVTAPAEGLTVDAVNAAYEAADCAPLIRRARKAAAVDAEKRARGLAEAVGLELGDILLVAETPVYAGVPGVGCTAAGPGFQPQGAGTYLPAYDPSAPAEVETYAQLNLAYAIA